ncbi:prostaglandin E synthase 3 isoform X1 [Cygnus olor]|uniref:prostaglandin E synthase 3 isoform X1 n=1 Tax=Cygnus olor TaxID=8869 RepID=UPI001ADE03A4|nr:prostaglandin E synthase 3 isoform X1 [Cygnus olor]
MRTLSSGLGSSGRGRRGGGGSLRLRPEWPRSSVAACLAGELSLPNGKRAAAQERFSCCGRATAHFDVWGKPEVGPSRDAASSPFESAFVGCRSEGQNSDSSFFTAVLISAGFCSWQPASAKWYDRRDYVFIEFCVEDSKDVNVNFEKSKLTFSCLGGSDNFKHLNEIDLFNNIDPNESKHKRTDRSILCCLRKGESGQAWPRLTKERAKLNWLSVDFNNWKDWEDDSDEDMSNFDRFSEMMNNMGGDDDVDLPEVDGAEDDSPDSDDEKMPDLE